jgi:hypothetical protein
MSWKKVGLLSRLMGKTGPVIDEAGVSKASDGIEINLGGVQLTWNDGEWTAGMQCKKCSREN